MDKKGHREGCFPITPLAAGYYVSALWGLTAFPGRTSVKGRGPP